MADETDIIQMVTCQAPVNIAVIKYCKNKESMLKTLFVRVILNLTFLQGENETKNLSYQWILLSALL